MDPLANLLNSFSLHAGVFYTGNICGIHDFERDTQRGHLHLIRSGDVQVRGVTRRRFSVTEPTLMFLPRPDQHRLVADEGTGADVVCATVQFGGAGTNPITTSLPDLVMVPLSQLPGVDALLDLMFDEAFHEQPGRQGVLDRLCEVLMVRLLRHCMAQGLTQGGTLAGLADARLGPVLAALHESPELEWDLPGMAQLAGMSRARFAVRFREVTGATPGDYLAGWRIQAAQRLLTRGEAIKQVAQAVGYGSASALSRAFVRKLGVAPGEWVAQQEPQIAD
ncbi:AraC family transcriptional regulator [Hydrogenophaga sp.]|uniref:AraC family transcriptional regulator n=1 Tax=Hydrogenophaga sp. TaxID=1904254 RepID=UPI0027303370|nr:AraC family transcriptional regulator [Hydrogenophaga sp.]MDP2405843.1 AraC family transcriptional regulator [Hydrogenophaga sp.]MDP3323086.1 AraC family transcriptional regulator [Hydrogenophaga sp.]MDP3886125.1 AraC family transcriptional regulator [Hydrogenophaga sp.]MDZ4173041.1 AraC family transcriptional regulator [Hydrogenophaga sp.]